MRRYQRRSAPNCARQQRASAFSVRTLAGAILRWWAGIGSIAAVLVSGSSFAEPGVTSQSEHVERGEYLAALLGCMGCHTEGFYTGGPFGAPMAGSRTGVTYQEGDDPEIAFPSNLTPDYDTGLGRWSDEEVGRAIRRGTHQRGGGLSNVMPYERYAKLHAADADAIAAYLRTLLPVNNKVPDAVPAGTRSTHPYVRILTTVHQPE